MRRLHLALPLLLPLLIAAPAVAQDDNAVELDGSLDFVDLGELDPGTDFTVEAWVRFDGLVLSQAVVSAAQLIDAFNAVYVGYVQGGWVVELDDDDEYENDDCDGANTLCLSQGLPTGVAVHVALSVQGSDASLYLDGVLVGQVNGDTGPSLGLDTWILGAETDGGSFGSDALHGVVDEVRVWSVARDAADIQCTKDWGLTGAEGGLYALWSMNENVFAAVAPDETGGGFDGLLIGDAAFVESPFGLTPSVGGDIPCLDGDSDGWTVGDGDCDDDDPTSNPGATEIPYDGADNDCAGDGDWTDLDGDGHDAEGVGGDDCDDGDPAVHPGAVETAYNGLDDDCDPTTLDDDLDQDGHGIATDCDDGDATINPDAPETVGDGVDSNCDGEDPPWPTDDDDVVDDDDLIDDDDVIDDDDSVVEPDDDDFLFDDDDSTAQPPTTIGCGCGAGGYDAAALGLLPLMLVGRRRRSAPLGRARRA